MPASGDSARPAWIVLLLPALLALLGSWPCVATPTRESGTSGAPSAPPPPPPPPPPPELLPDEYYDQLEDTPPAGLQPNRTEDAGPRLCDYDMCREGEAPCSEREALTGCLCPGVTLEDVTPEAPSLRPLAADGYGRAVVRWCAPYSVVTAYGVRVAEVERVTLGSGRRSSALEGLNDGDRVCVFAVNAMGDGPESCATYRVEEDNVLLKAGLIGGALGLALLVALALLLWKYTQRRRSGAGIATQDRADSQQAHPVSDRVALDVL